MTFDDGIVKVFSVQNIEKPGMKPGYGLKIKSQHYFGYETVGINRYRAALQTQNQINSLIHIWQDTSIVSTDICIPEDGKQYKCGLIQHMINEDGLKITKIELERLGEDYVIKEDIQDT